MAKALKKKTNKRIWKKGINNTKLASIASETQQRKGLILT